MNSHEQEMTALVNRLLPIATRLEEEIRKSIRENPREGQTWLHTDSLRKIGEFCILMGENEISPFLFVIAEEARLLPKDFEGAPLPPMQAGAAMHGACSQRNAAFRRTLFPKLAEDKDADGTRLNSRNRNSLETGCTSLHPNDQALFTLFTAGKA